MNKYDIAAVMALMTAGCASTKMPPAQLTDARQAVDHAKESRGAELVLVDLHNAEKALDCAERSWKVDEHNPRTNDLAYVAQRKAELAEVRGETAFAAKQTADAQKDMMKHYADMSSGDRQKLAEVQGKLSEAEAGKRDALAQLKRHEGRSVKEDSRGVVITIAGNLLFESDKASLMPSAKEQLEDIAKSLQSAKGRKISIEGHTDSTGGNARNDTLSQRRAEAVMEFFIKQGLPPDEIRAAGRGSSNPIADNSKAEGRASNRRVEIVVHAEKGAPQEG